MFWFEEVLWEVCYGLLVVILNVVSEIWVDICLILVVIKKMVIGLLFLINLSGFIIIV